MIGGSLNHLLLLFLDNNECTSNDTNACQQVCVNIRGSYLCQCNAGFRLSNDRRNCIGKYGKITHNFFIMCLNYDYCRGARV